MKHIYFYILFFIIIFNTHAQQTTVSAGNTTIGVGGSASYSIGQVVYTTHIGTNGSMAEGVQQPYEIYSLKTYDFTDIVLNWNAYPNPTSNLLTLEIINYDVSSLRYLMIDLSGKIIETNKITQDKTEIDMSNRVSSTYLVTLIENNKTLKTFKIIKK
jgi:hypothetical protein